MITSIRSKATRDIKNSIRKLEAFTNKEMSISAKIRRNRQTMSLLADMEEWDDVTVLDIENDQSESILLQEKTQILSECEFLIQRICGNGYWYESFLEKISIYEKIGLLKSLFEEIKTKRYNFVEITRAEIFSDYLSMADSLLNDGYKDASAVIIGSTLEEHLRKLAVKNGISIDSVNAKGQTIRKKASALNSDLQSSKIYGMLDFKNIIAWLDLRNSAAHGNYSNYTKNQVKLMLDGVQNFISHNPA
jgi:RiboL-PSP-HEPN